MTTDETQQNHFTVAYDELRSQFMGQNKLLDAVLPPGIFMIVNSLWGLQAALFTAVGTAAVFSAVRLMRREKLWFSLSGLLSVFVAAGFAWWMSRAEGFFLPSILSNTALVLISLLSVLLKKPLMAWISHYSRGWPRAWYWHPRVRPAYGEVTLVWVILMAVRLVVQLFLYTSHRVNALGVFQIITGTPATVVLLVLSYLYGAWRLKRLHGPSVQEYQNGDPPPWQGQQRGF